MNCPFNDDVKCADDKEEPENIAKDDKDDVQGVQANNGGKLGQKMSDGSYGTDNTWKGAPYEPPELKEGDKESPKDSNRRNGKKYSKPWAKVRVPGTKVI